MKKYLTFNCKALSGRSTVLAWPFKILVLEHVPERVRDLSPPKLDVLPLWISYLNIEFNLKMCLH